MQPLKKRLTRLTTSTDHAYSSLQIDERAAELAELEQQAAQPEIWHNPSQAAALHKKVAHMASLVEPWQTLRAQLADLAELMELGDESLAPEFDGQITALEAEYQRLHRQLLFTGPYDTYAAVLRITAGVGGVDAQDFAAMLERMYLRWAEQHDITTAMITRSAGEEAGIKTSVVELEGAYAYGQLKGEHGVHRLVRLSPFNADNLRQTSFALVEVLPRIETPDEVTINPNDLKIDVYRSGGNGGQGVNTTDSAVRVTHIPTGITVAIQNERSQLQNKDVALRILRSKLLAMQLEQHAETLADLRAGESAGWGAQIRNYVLHPYTLVKDTRTKHEQKNATAVLGGDLDGFITAYLEQHAGAA